MSESRQITIDQVRVGDTISLRRVTDAGTDNELISTIQGVVEFIDIGNRGIRFRGLYAFYMPDDLSTITLLRRPPTKRPITLDDLKDWQKVPVGTRIEFVELPIGNIVKGSLIGRYQAGAWSVKVEGFVGWFDLAAIKKDTLFVIEEVTP